jgi:hypothetical protein
MRVDTAGKSGHFSVSGMLLWTVGERKPWPVHLFLEGTANAVLSADPFQIQFSATDIRDQAVKQLSLYSNLPVNWSTLRVHSEPPYVEVTDESSAKDHFKVKLRAVPPTESREFSATLFFTVGLADPSNAEIKDCSLAVPVNGVQQIGIQVAPSVVLIRFPGNSPEGSAHFILRGNDLPRGPRPIDSIVCDGFEASWELREVTSQSATGLRMLHVDLKLSRRDGVTGDSTRPRRVAIRMVDRVPLEVPLVVVQPEG